MSKVALCFSFNTNKTSLAAKKIAEAFGQTQVELVNAESITPEEFLSYKKYILGVPTWFDGELPNYWDEFIPALEDLDLKGRKFALFGNGDQKGYPENFVDGIIVFAPSFTSSLITGAIWLIFAVSKCLNASGVTTFLVDALGFFLLFLPLK